MKDRDCAEPPVQKEREPCGCIYDSFATVYYHPATHWIVEVSTFGDSLVIEDGSFWKISKYDSGKIKTWHLTDPITITQNHRWFSSYNYRIVNQLTGTSLEANLFLGPHEQGLNTLRITGIDKLSGDLVLTNGMGEVTRWEISSGDIFTFQNWGVQDAIIIGQNTGWDSVYEGLLINVNMNDCARAKQI